MSKTKKKLRSKNAFAVISYMINLDSLNEIVGPSEMLKAIWGILTADRLSLSQLIKFRVFNFCCWVSPTNPGQQY